MIRDDSVLPILSSSPDRPAITSGIFMEIYRRSPTVWP